MANVGFFAGSRLNRQCSAARHGFSGIEQKIQERLLQLPGVRLHAVTRHLHGLFQGVPGARAFRRRLAEAAGCPQADAALFLGALALIRDDNLDDTRVAA